MRWLPGRPRRQFSPPGPHREAAQAARWQRLSQAQQELAALSVPDTFPLASAEEFRQLRRQLVQVSEELAAAAAELGDIDAELGRIVLAPP